ncbi:MAG: hypothetical protein WCT29_01155 [Candidatus Paceibacterota bacterium]|jgi:hypothetical protein
MKTKVFFLALALVLLGSAVGAGSVSAQTASFPEGCASGLGYSITSGEPCNGTNNAVTNFLPGCTTALGYSTVNGAACSGGPIAIEWLAGCSSILGYSTVNGMPCNGTATAYLTTPSPYYIPSVPGLPTTGSGDNALINFLFLGSSALVVALGINFLSRKSQA